MGFAGPLEGESTSGVAAPVRSRGTNLLAQEHTVPFDDSNSVKRLELNAAPANPFAKNPGPRQQHPNASALLPRGEPDLVDPLKVYGGVGADVQ